MASLGNAPPGEDNPAGEFWEWVAPHWELMRRLAILIAHANDVEDALQTALLAAWRKRSSYDPARGSVRGWLLAITANEARKTHRYRKRTEPAIPLNLPATDARVGDIGLIGDSGG